MYDSIPALVERMVADLGRLPDGDARRFFHATYLRTTRAVAEEIDRGGLADGAWLGRWDIAFARPYLDVLDADLRGEPLPRPRRVALLPPRRQPHPPPPRHPLLRLAGHIHHALPP